MRYDTAVSEVLGAVLLIGLVVVAFTIIAAVFLSSAPSQSSNNPIATTSSHCVKCDENRYQIYVSHDGGEPYVEDDLKFKVTFDGSSGYLTPNGTYTGQPSECTATPLADQLWAGDVQKKAGTGTETFKAGEVLLFDNLPEAPKSLVITDPNNQPIDTFSYEAGGKPVIKDLTDVARGNEEAYYNSTVESGAFVDTGSVKPVLNVENLTTKMPDDYCYATFYYDNTLGVSMAASPCTGQPLIFDDAGNLISGQDTCSRPWNEFIGVGSLSDDWTFLKKDMGQPKVFDTNEKEGQSLAARSFTVRFKNAIKWRLGNSYSVAAACESCGANEAYVWGYMFLDANKNGVRDANETGFTSGSVHLVGRYKNNPTTENFDDTYPVDSSGRWQSRCIKMSGWAFDLDGIIPSGYTNTTQLAYPGYDEKITGEAKKNPPRVDFGVAPIEVPTITPTPTPTPLTPTPTPTVIPVDSGGVGAVLYDADNTTDVIVEFAFSDAGYDNVFSLSSPRVVSLGSGHSTPVGTSWNLGTFTAGQELKFADVANGKTYYTGPASRNPDGFYHGAVTLKNSTGTYHKYLVTFEDYWQGGDKDYNDVEFYVSGNLFTMATPTPTPTPTPAPTATPSSDTTPPSVSISSPVPGVSWSKNTYHTISWSATDTVGVTQIVIKLSTDGGSSYPYTVLSTSSNTGSYNWYVPNKKTTMARLKVTAYDAAGNPGNKESGTFKITN
jgi:FlaG/FlaF family flagellin (archaellin)